jgi:Spy/CpxP family protein refolding chaperone
MTTRFKISLAAGITALTMAAAAPMLIAQDQPQRRQGPGISGPRAGGPGGPGMRRGPGGPMGLGPGFGQLDLTDDQKAQLKTIADSHRNEFQAAGQKIGAAREAMRTLIQADAIDESAIRAKSAEVAAAEADLAILNAKVRKESQQVLTSEQLAKLKELQANREGRMKQRRPRAQQ